MCIRDRLYILLGIGVILIHINRVPMVFAQIFECAFSPRAITGGAVGGMFMAMKKGFSRGIFSNEAGLGTGSIAHSATVLQLLLPQLKLQVSN